MFFFIFASVGFIASILVHSLTYAGVDVASEVPYVWLLHVGCFVAFVPLIGKNPWNDVFGTLPNWGKLLVGLLFAYAVVNIVLFFLRTAGGSPAILDGRYVMHDHGTIIRELSADEYHLQEAYELRGFSGHWMFIYLLSSFYLCGLIIRRAPDSSIVRA
jgi:hypothetical protein